MASRKGGGGGGGGGAKNEVLVFKSPAEFFAENQNIAGYDNAGKALYTTIREFVENALDACESAGRLPNIALTVQEMDAATLNAERGIAARRRKDHSLYSGAEDEDEEDEEENEADEEDEDEGARGGAKAAAAASPPTTTRGRLRSSVSPVSIFNAINSWTSFGCGGIQPEWRSLRPPL